MELLFGASLRADRAAVEPSPSVLLPIMAAMPSARRLAEARGLLDWLVARLAPSSGPWG